MQARLSTKSELSYVSDHIHYIVIWPKSRGPYSAEWRNILKHGMIEYP